MRRTWAPKGRTPVLRHPYRRGKQISMCGLVAYRPGQDDQDEPAAWMGFDLLEGAYDTRQFIRVLDGLGHQLGHQPTTVIWDVAWFGERVQVTAALLRVATGVAGFAGLYYAVTILVDSTYRDQFVDALGEQLRDTFERRSEYLELLRRRGVAVAPGEPTLDA